MDSQYIADPYKGGYLNEDNPNLIKYDNFDLLAFFIYPNTKMSDHCVENLDLEIEDVQGHALNFGNLEVDCVVSRAFDKYYRVPCKTYLGNPEVWHGPLVLADRQ